MTLGEFKAWLEGFEHSFTDGVPNALQWKAIKEGLAAVQLVTPREPGTHGQVVWNGPPFHKGGPLPHFDSDQLRASAVRGTKAPEPTPLEEYLSTLPPVDVVALQDAECRKQAEIKRHNELYGETYEVAERKDPGPSIEEIVKAAIARDPRR